MSKSSSKEVELGVGTIRIRFRMPKDPRAEMFDVHKVFLTTEDAEKFIQDNKDWLPYAEIVKVTEFVIASYENGKKI